MRSRPSVDQVLDEDRRAARAKQRAYGTAHLPSYPDASLPKWLVSLSRRCAYHDPGPHGVALMPDPARDVRARRATFAGPRGAGGLVRGLGRPGRRRGHACRCSRCGRWRAGRHSTGPTCTPRSRRSSEAHEHAFAYFGGVFRLLTLRQLPASAVRKILRMATGGRRPCGLWQFRLGIGAIHGRVLARRAKVTRKAASRARAAISLRNHPRPGALGVPTSHALNASSAGRVPGGGRGLRILDGRTEPVGVAIEVVARDRAGAYADGIRQGAPEATSRYQIAGSLLRNLGDAVRAIVDRQRCHGAIQRVDQTARRAEPQAGASGSAAGATEAGACHC